MEEISESMAEVSVASRLTLVEMFKHGIVLETLAPPLSLCNLEFGSVSWSLGRRLSELIRESETPPQKSFFIY